MCDVATDDDLDSDTEPWLSCWHFCVVLGRYWIHFIAWRPHMQTIVILGFLSVPLGSARIMLFEIRS